MNTNSIFHRRFMASGFAGLVLAGITALPVSAQTLTFDSLPTAPGAAGDAFFPDANSGSRTLSGITFNASSSSDWEIIGNQYQAPFSSDPFGSLIPAAIISPVTLSPA